jgi:hypothetical protein
MHSSVHGQTSRQSFISCGQIFYFMRDLCRISAKTTFSFILLSWTIACSKGASTCFVGSLKFFGSERLRWIEKQGTGLANRRFANALMVADQVPSTLTEWGLSILQESDPARYSFCLCVSVNVAKIIVLGRNTLITHILSDMSIFRALYCVIIFV